MKKRGGEHTADGIDIAGVVAVVGVSVLNCGAGST